MASSQSGGWSSNNAYNATISYSGTAFYAYGTWSASVATVDTATGLRRVTFTVFCSVYGGAAQPLGSIASGSKWSGYVSGTNAAYGAATPKQGTATFTKDFTDMNEGTLTGTIYTGFSGQETSGFSTNYSLTYGACEDKTAPTVTVQKNIIGCTEAHIWVTVNKAVDEIQYSTDNINWNSKNTTITSSSGGTDKISFDGLLPGTNYTLYIKAKATTNSLWSDNLEFTTNTNKFFSGKLSS